MPREEILRKECFGHLTANEALVIDGAHGEGGGALDCADGGLPTTCTLTPIAFLLQSCSMRRVLAGRACLVAALSGSALLAACGTLVPTQPAPTPLPPDQAMRSDSVGLVYEPSSGGLLRADHRGLFSWLPSSGWAVMQAPSGASLSAVAVSPKQPDTIFVGGRNLGVMRSEDGGETWLAVNSGLPSLDVTALATHSYRRKTLFAWLAWAGIHRSEDGGGSWLRMPDSGPPDVDVRGLMHSALPGSMNTGWLYAATPTGAYLSMDCF